MHENNINLRHCKPCNIQIRVSTITMYLYLNIQMYFVMSYKGHIYLNNNQL